MLQNGTRYTEPCGRKMSVHKGAAAVVTLLYGILIKEQNKEIFS